MNKGIQSLSDGPRDGGPSQQRARYPSTPAHKLDSVFLIDHAPVTVRQLTALVLSARLSEIRYGFDPNTKA